MSKLNDKTHQKRIDKNCHIPDLVQEFSNVENHYRSMYDLQHGALAHTEQQAGKGPTITSVKPFKRENKGSNLYKKRETRINYINKLHVSMVCAV